MERETRLELATPTLARFSLTLLLQFFRNCKALAVVYRCSALFIVVLFSTQIYTQILRSFDLGLAHLLQLLEQPFGHVGEPACGCFLRCRLPHHQADIGGGPSWFVMDRYSTAVDWLFDLQTLRKCQSPKALRRY